LLISFKDRLKEEALDNKMAGNWCTRCAAVNGRIIKLSLSAVKQDGNLSVL